MTELGKRLKEAREEKGISLDELQRITKIQKRYLQNVEEGNYEALPGVFYARAFVKQYAEVVGLDPEMVFVEYKNDIPNTQKESIPEQLSRVKRSRAEVNTKDSKILPILLRIIVAVLLIGFAVTIWTVLQNKNSEQVEDPTEVSTGTEIEKNPENPLESEDDLVEEEEVIDVPEVTQPIEPVQKIEMVDSSGINTTYKLSNTPEFLVEVSATNETWVILRNGKNKEFFSDMLTSDETDTKPSSTTYDFINETEAFIRLGYSANAVVKINGEILEIPAVPKDTQNITIIFEKSTE